MNNLGQHSNMNHEVIAGGNWNNSSNAGVGNVNLNNNRTNSNNNVGVRDFISMPETSRDDTGNIGVCCPAKSEIKNTNNLLSNLGVENQIMGKTKRPKRIGYLFEKAFSMENLYQAFLDARKGKRKKRATLNFEKNLGTELLDLYNELHAGTYEPRPYNQFIVYEPKERIINAPHFRDLVVQHCIYRVIYPIFDRSFVNTSFACRKGGGTHKASIYTQKEMRKYSGDEYFIKLDIRKFFYSIDRDILKKFFEEKIKDKRFVELMCVFTEMDSDKGIPIGNLLSQIYALIYMNKLDHYIKRELKVKSYVRYVDDFIIMGANIEEAKKIKNKCEEFVKNKLKLSLSHWHIQKIKRGINFVGYRTWKSVKFVRKHSMYKFKKAIKKSRIESIVSLIGHAKDTATIPFFVSLLTEYGIINQLPKGVRKCLNMQNM